MPNLTEYTGNAGLGLGSNSDVPAIATKDLDVINNSLDRLQTQNAVRNQNIFQQKIKDRDALIAAIDSGDIKVKDLLEQDMPTVKEGLQKLDEAYFSRIKKGVNDLDAAREYKKALRDAQDRVTQAQARKVHYDALNGQIAKETLPRKQEAMKKHLDQTINGGFFKDLTPFQTAQDLDIAGSILSTAANTVEQFTDPKQPLIKGKRTMFDYDKTFLANKDNFLNDVNKRHDQEQLMTAVQSQNPNEFLETIGAMNNRIKEYNALRNLTAGQPGFVKEVKFTIDPQTGKALINEALPDFAAKYTLAHQKPFGSIETEFDKDQGAYLVAKQKANTDAFYKRSMAGAANTRAKAYSDNIRQQMKLRETDAEKDEFLEEMYKRNIIQQPTLILGMGGNKVTTGVIKAENSLPIFTLDGKTVKQLIPIGGKPVYSPDSYAEDGSLKAGSKPLYYEGGHFEPTYRVGGKSVESKQLVGIYNNFKRIQGDKWKGGFDEFIKEAVKNGDIKVLLKGANGTTDEELSRAAQRIISNSATKKGQTEVFEYSEDPIPDNNQ